MSIEYFISRVGRYLSIIAFIIVLLFTYRGLPDAVAVHFGADGRGDGFLAKNQVFYIFGAIMFSLNLVIVILVSNVKKMPSIAFKSMPNQDWLKDPKQLVGVIINWINFLPTIINIFLILSLRALLALNDERSFNKDYSYLLVLGIVLLLIWLFYIPIRILYTKPKIEE